MNKTIQWNPWKWKDGVLVRAGKTEWRKPAAQDLVCPYCGGASRLGRSTLRRQCQDCNRPVPPACKIPPNATIEVCLASDFCDPDADEMRDEAWKIMALRPDVHWVISIGMVERLGECLPKDWFSPGNHCGVAMLPIPGNDFYDLCVGCKKPIKIAHTPWPNVTLLARADTQDQLAERWAALVKVPAARHGVDFVGLREGVDLAKACPCSECKGSGLFWADDIQALPCQFCNGTGIDPRLAWVRVIGGTEPMHPAWVRGIRDACSGAGVAFWFGGWGEWFPRSQWEDSPDLILPDDNEIDSDPGSIVLGDEPLHRAGPKQSGHTLDGETHREMVGGVER